MILYVNDILPTGVQRLRNAQVSHQGQGGGRNSPLTPHPYQKLHHSKVNSDYGKSQEGCKLLQMAMLIFFTP